MRSNGIASALGVVGSFFLVLSLCSAVRAEERAVPQKGSATFTPTAAESNVAQRFRLAPGAFPWQATPLGADSKTVEVWDVTFPSPVVTPFEANNTVHCEYFQPKREGKRPAVIVLHILGGDFPLSRLFCNRLAQQGVAALFVKMPYYGPRRGEGVARRMISVNPDETVEGMTQAVLDIRRSVAWLGSREEVDPDQIGVFGISLGGITGALAATAEPRLQNICLLLAGGDIGRVALDSPELKKVRGDLPKALGDKASLEKALRVIDPVTYAANARGRRILLLNAERDEVIPRACTDSLHQALGGPEIVWYSGGHYSVIRHLFAALDRVANFFAAVDGALVPQPIYRTTAAVTIDGKLDEPCWQAAQPVLVNRRLGRAGRFAEPPPMSVRMAWDEQYLYWGFELPHGELSAEGPDARHAELFLSSGGLEEFWLCRHVPGSELSVTRHCVPPEAEWRERGPARNVDVTTVRVAKIPRKQAASHASQLPGQKGEPATGEIRIPWGLLEMTPETGRELKLLAAVTSGKGAAATTHTTGELPNQPPPFSASRWPRYRLAE